jgi:hypothetical protein
MSETTGTTATETTWSGWWRPDPRHPWRRVVSGCPDSASAWTELLRRSLPSGDLQVSRGDDADRPYRAGGLR